MPYPNQFSQPYQYQYQPQVPAPMDNLSQLRAQQYQIPQMQQPPQTNQGLQWVQGEAAARSYLIAPNNTVLLMDSETPVFYLKTADSSGMPLPLRVFDYKERIQNVQQNMPQNALQDLQAAQNILDDKYVTRQEYDGLQGKYDYLQGKYMEILNRLDNFPVLPVVSEGGKKPAAANNKTRNRGGDSHE